MKKNIVMILYICLAVQLAPNINGQTNAVDNQERSILKGVTKENYSDVIKQLDALEINYKVCEKNIFILSEELSLAVDSLRFSGILIYPEVYFSLQTGKFIAAEDFIPSESSEKFLRMSMIDNLDDDKIDEAENILQSWKMDYRKYHGTIAVPTETKSAVIQKFKSCGLLLHGRQVRFILSATPVYATADEMRKRQLQQKELAEKQTQDNIKELIRHEVLKEKDIFEVDIVMLTPEKWQIKILYPLNYKWTELQKEHIASEIKKKTIMPETLKGGENLIIIF